MNMHKKMLRVIVFLWGFSRVLQVRRVCNPKGMSYHLLLLVKVDTN